MSFPILLRKGALFDMQVISQPLPGVYLFKYSSHKDDRGTFIKSFSSAYPFFIQHKFIPQEVFYTVSSQNTIRGMHYQSGLAAQDKVVVCQHGSILDVVVDINPASKYFNKPFSTNLTSTNNLGLFISKGYAHGFLSLQNNSMVLYSTSTVHSPDCDQGVLWSSIDFIWPIDFPIVSTRDSSHPHILQTP